MTIYGRRTSCRRSLLPYARAPRDGAARALWWSTSALRSSDITVSKVAKSLPDLLEVNTIPTGSSVIAELSLVREIGGFDPALARLRRLGRLDQAGSAFAACGSRSPPNSLSSGQRRACPWTSIACGLAARSSSTDMPRLRPSMAPSRRRRRTSAISPSSSCVVDRDCRPLPYSRASRSSTAAGVSFRVSAAALIAPRLTDRLGPVACGRGSSGSVAP